MKQIVISEAQAKDLLALLDDVAAKSACMGYNDWKAIRNAVAVAVDESNGWASLRPALLQSQTMLAQPESES